RTLSHFHSFPTRRSSDLHTHAHVLGQVIRLCLFCGVEALFTPFYEGKRNYQIESFHSLWVRGFWSRHAFSSCAQVEAEVVLFREDRKSTRLNSSHDQISY